MTPRFGRKRAAERISTPGRCSGRTWASSTWISSPRWCPNRRREASGFRVRLPAAASCGAVRHPDAWRFDMDEGDRITLDHLDSLTDSTGLIQHAIYNIPRRDSGYTTDDNARALRLCTRLWGLFPEERMLRRVTRYLGFLEYARTPSGGVHN